MILIESSTLTTVEAHRQSLAGSDLPVMLVTLAFNYDASPNSYKGSSLLLLLMYHYFTYRCSKELYLPVDLTLCTPSAPSDPQKSEDNNHPRFTGTVD